MQLTPQSGVGVIPRRRSEDAPCPRWRSASAHRRPNGKPTGRYLRALTKPPLSVIVARLGSARLGSARLGSARLGSARQHYNSQREFRICQEREPLRGAPAARRLGRVINGGLYLQRLKREDASGCCPPRIQRPIHHVTPSNDRSSAQDGDALIQAHRPENKLSVIKTFGTIEPVL